MNRRRFLQLVSSAALAAQATGFGQAANTVRVSAKKGVGLAAKGPHWKENLKSLRARWMYSWYSRKPDGLPPGVEFVPMIWGYQNAAALGRELASSKQAGAPAVLAFNEPDSAGQANLGVETVLEEWPKLMATPLRLGSPACVQPDGKWMEEFMRKADKLKYRVDFVCIHSYAGPDAGALTRRLTRIHEMYGRPLWITEFAVGDWNAKTVKENRFSRASVLTFMKECLPALDELNFLERYAWFPADGTNPELGTSALFNPDQTLTPLGELYAAH